MEQILTVEEIKDIIGKLKAKYPEKEAELQEIEHKLEEEASHD